MNVIERYQYMEAALLEILGSEDDLEHYGAIVELLRVKAVARRAIDRVTKEAANDKMNIDNDIAW